MKPEDPASGVYKSEGKSVPMSVKNRPDENQEKNKDENKPNYEYPNY